MEKLCSQVYVLRQIALNYIPAHAAFLFNKYYRKQYNNFGCNLELIAMHGKWMKSESDDKQISVIYFESNNSLFFPKYTDVSFHPFCPGIKCETKSWLLLMKKCHYGVFHLPKNGDEVEFYSFRYTGCKHNLTEEQMSSYNLRDLFQKASELYEILEKTKKVPLNLKDYVPFEFEFLDTPCEVVTHTRTKQ